MRGLHARLAVVLVVEHHDAKVRRPLREQFLQAGLILRDQVVGPDLLAKQMRDALDDFTGGDYPDDGSGWDALAGFADRCPHRLAPLSAPELGAVAIRQALALQRRFPEAQIVV